MNLKTIMLSLKSLRKKEHLIISCISSTRTGRSDLQCNNQDWVVSGLMIMFKMLLGFGVSQCIPKLRYYTLKFVHFIVCIFYIKRKLHIMLNSG